MDDFASSHLIARVQAEAPALYDELVSLWEVVKPSAEYVKLIFPEYTPHDVTHLQRLFNLADKLLSPNIKTNLNRVECFLLAAAIIGHDWGMGLTDYEQQAIIKGKQGKIEPEDTHDRLQTNITLLQTETQRLLDHSKANDITFEWTPGIGVSSPKQKHAWQDYLRETHPERSAERIRHFFEPKEALLGEAIAIIAHGHGRETTTIEQELYPISKTIHGEKVNIQALTLYLRLIDLLDIAKGRTPYELWRYINPGNERSAAEWKKHRSLEEPAFDNHSIHWSALVNEGPILAELYDLRDACKTELSWQCGLLKSRHDERYHYSRCEMQWDIAASGTLHNRPVKFNFARNELLHLLSEEIYDGDPYVFIRELLQNSIDATKTRVERRKETDTPLSKESTFIDVRTGIDKDGTSTITIRDPGTGMSAYIIENYLSVAGKSYYQSPSFRKLGLKLDPISRFGIGILSCFVVASRVFIRTKTDPDCFISDSSKELEAWSIEIQTGGGTLPLGHWDWRRLDDRAIPVGTEVTVFLDSTKLDSQLKRLTSDHPHQKLKITDYLKAIAGFVEIPICVEEEGQKTVIISPYTSHTTIPSRLADFTTHFISRNYSPSLHISPLDIELFNEFLSLETRDLSTLEIPGVSGFLSYAKPKKPWRVKERYAFRLTLEDQTGKTITLSGPTFHSGHDAGLMENFRAEGVSKSAMRSIRSGVFLNGILVPVSKEPSNIGLNGKYTSSVLAFPNLFVNYSTPNRSDIQLGPSRLTLIGTENTWADTVMAAHSQEVAKERKSELLCLSPLDRMKEITRILNEDFVGVEEFAGSLGWDEWPISVLLSGGEVKIMLMKEINWPVLISAPRIIAKLASSQLENLLEQKSSKKNLLKNWKGDACVFDIHNIPSIEQTTFSGIPLNKKYYHSLENLPLTPPHLLSDKGKYLPAPPLYATIHKLGSKSYSQFWTDIPISLLEAAAHDPLSLSNQDLLRVTRIAPTSLCFVKNEGQRPKRFNSYCLWSEDTINLSHPKGLVLFSRYYTYALARFRNTLNAREKALLEKTFTQLGIKPYDTRDERINSLQALNEKIREQETAILMCPSPKWAPICELCFTQKDLLPGPFLFLDADSYYCFTFDGDLIAEDKFQEITSAAKEDYGQLLDFDSSWPS